MSRKPRDLDIDLSGAKVLGIRLPEFGLDPAPATRPSPDPTPRYTKPGEERMNKTERRYAARLEERKYLGQVYRWDFEPEKFRLANSGDACFYTPDFRLLLNDGTVEFHEVKGFMREDALLKIKWFVREHPYPLVVVRWSKGAWHEERWQG